MSEELSSIVEFSIDLNDQEAPDPLPVGVYTGIIRKAEVRESQRGTRYGAVSFHIGADQYPADFTDGPEDGLTLIYRRVGLEDNPQSRFGTKRFMESIGAALSKKVDVNEWVGMEAALDVIHDTYEGVTRAVVERVRAI
ncbi:hypothetical protein LCGC14_1105660 [marine sediment metagenome]|uniref:DUF669 domain-containing protein n=1 Tax=marine sediment metagenome TaxID=412755 RepID=A0A0F9QEG3_9ZZZZ